MGLKHKAFNIKFDSPEIKLLESDRWIKLSDVNAAVKQLKEKLAWYENHDSSFPYNDILKLIDEVFGVVEKK